ncbi:MAG TPA: DUF2891 family protein [Acidobacteriaceae bacterium]|jgi:hypothetical protein
MKLTIGALILSIAGSAHLAAQSSDPAKLSAYLKTLPPVPQVTYGEAERETLAASAISCADHPQQSPSNRNSYLWVNQRPAELLDGYERNRAFYGCGTWHDAVSSTWMLISILKQDPKISLASDIKDVATTHFRTSNMSGELAFFSRETPIPAGGPGGGGAAAAGAAAAAPAGGGGEGGGGMAFERPYGYAWFQKFYGEAKSWNSADGKKLAIALAPLARWMSERSVFYLYDLKFPQRNGVESNTAWAMSLMLDGANLAENETLKTAIHDNAIRLFAKDKNCATGFEPQNSDLISSCLSEAALMGRVMEQGAYVKWLDGFLPPIYSDAFQGYAKDTDVSHTDLTGSDPQVQAASRSRLIALNFQRATSMLTIGYALPKDDPRVPVLRHIAALDAGYAYSKVGIAGYEGQHLIDVYAVLYENAVKGPAPLAPPPKPKNKNAQQAADPETP